MKPIAIITTLVLCATLVGCAPRRTEPADTTTTSASTVLDIETETLPASSDEPILSPTLDMTVETFPQPSDDSDYQLPPGERPTVPPEVQ